MKKKIFMFVTLMAVVLTVAVGCDVVVSDTEADMENTLEVGNKLVANQPTPTDIDYSLERYNLIKRAYWVNGMRDRARALPTPIADMPLGYIVLLSESGAVVGRFVVDGKVSSLNSYLTPDSQYYACSGEYCPSNGVFDNNENNWLPDVDGSYGSNDNGIFFFTTDGKYIEWTGTYLYSDIPFKVSNPIVQIGE